MIVTLNWLTAIVTILIVDAGIKLANPGRKLDLYWTVRNILMALCGIAYIFGL